MGMRHWLRTWNDERSPWARARDRERERRALISALPTAAVHRVIERLMQREIPIDPEAPDYSVQLANLLEGTSFEATLTIARGPFGDHDVAEPADDDAIIVGILGSGAVFVRSGSPAIRALSASEPIAPSLAHLVLETVLGVDDARALARDPAGWEPNPQHRDHLDFDPALGPSRSLGPEAFALDERPRRWALVGSIVVLPVSLMLVPFGVWALRGAVCGGLLSIFLGLFGCWHSLRRLEEVLWLEPRLVAMAPSPEGFLDRGRRRAWSEVLAYRPGAFRSTLVLRDGRQLVLPHAGFRHGEAAMQAIARACAQRGATRYRDV